MAVGSHYWDSKANYVMRFGEVDGRNMHIVQVKK